MTPLEFKSLKNGDVIVRTIHAFYAPKGYKTEVVMIDGIPRYKHLSPFETYFDTVHADLWELASKEKRTSGFGKFIQKIEGKKHAEQV